MKKLLVFLLVLGCILSVEAYTPWELDQYNRYQYDRYSQFPSFWGQSRYVQNPYLPMHYSQRYFPSYYSQAYHPQASYAPRPFPILATGYAIQPDPGDRFPWAYYPDHYAQQYYDLDDGEVVLKGNSALPSTVRVKVGDTVIWRSKEGFPHVIKSARGSSESFDSGSLIFGESFSKQFNQEGSYDYYDPLYSWVRGRVVVSSS
ncbi:MAG TPA: hypothetical protein VJG90_01205 [Candidatus Nanoarchaeia archaeon]|nr:hypothetical protein [Candidatus Nanoarchaeia archaeon]